MAQRTMRKELDGIAYNMPGVDLGNSVTSFAMPDHPGMHIMAHPPLRGEHSKHLEVWCDHGHSRVSRPQERFFLQALKEAAAHWHTYHSSLTKAAIAADHGMTRPQGFVAIYVDGGFRAYCQADGCGHVTDPYQRRDTAVSMAKMHQSRRHVPVVGGKAPDGFFVERTPGGWRARCQRPGCAAVSALMNSALAAADRGHSHQATMHTQAYLDATKPTVVERDGLPAYFDGTTTDPDSITSYSWKGTDTMRTLTTVDRELALAQARLETLIAEREQLAKRPAEPKNTLITFDIRYPNGDIKYSYAAIKAAGLWWLTGRDGARGRTWDEMLEFMSQDESVVDGEPIRFRSHRKGDGFLIRGEK